MNGIKFTTGKRIEIGNNKVLYIVKSGGKYQAEVLDTKTADMEYSKWYSDKKALNNFLKKYDVELIFERVVIKA